MNALTYKGMSARIEFDAEDQVFVGRIAGINDVVGFHGDSVEALVGAFHDAVDDYFDVCARIGKDPERAYSGKLMLRIRPELHQALALRAELAGKSLNQLSEEALAAAV